MLLYNSPVSGNCYKVRLLLAQLGIEYERHQLDVFDRSDRPEVLGGLNPALRVPTVAFDDGRTLAESGAILFHFAEGTDYMPRDAFEREFLVGGRYSIADIAVFGYTHVAPEGGFELEPYGAVREWLARVAAQPGHIAITD